MDKKRAWLVVVAVLSLLIVASLACGPSAPTAPPAEESPIPAEATPTPPPAEETPEAAETPEAVETPEAAETPEEEEEPFSATTEALDQLDSFSGYVHWQGWVAPVGEVQEADFEIRGQRQNRPTRAEHWTWTDHKEGTSLEWIAIEAENNMWTREEGGEWQEIGMYSPDMMEMFSIFSYDFWASLFFEGLPEEATFVGQETVNGILCRHYRSVDASGWGFTIVGSAELNVWIAVEGEYPVKSTADVSGTYEGESFDWHLITEISNVNQPVDISPPMQKSSGARWLAPPNLISLGYTDSQPFHLGKGEDVEG